MRVLSGIQPSGSLHLGNYFGMMSKMIAYQEESELFCFIANYHAQTSLSDGKVLARGTIEAAANFLALGMDPEKSTFWVQSDVPEVQELTWILSNFTPMGLLERCHSYKDKIGKGIAANHGLFAYPVLMTADILLFQSEKVPVGKDQKQHVEMARDIAQRFNHHYGETFVLPEPVIGEHTAVLKGLDGRKMSKSYNNTIPLFANEKQLRKLIMKIKTNSLEPGEPKDTADSTLFEIYKAFASEEEVRDIEKRYAEGIAWGEMKQLLFEYINEHLKPAREEYERLIANPGIVEAELLKGAGKARERSAPFLAQIRDSIGIRRLG